MYFRLLGLIEASTDGAPLPIGGPRQRSVLADLVLHAGETVATAQLIDDIWGEQAPDSASHTLETYIFRLRQVLRAPGSDAAVITRPTGYLLETPPENVDVCMFRELARNGRAAADRRDDAMTASLLTDALALWRGPALADIRDAPFAVVAADRLSRERLTVVEQLLDARLAMGEDAELVPELDRLVGEAPYREHLHAQLMTALYRSGRQAEALEAFRRARRHLVGDLGIEPGPELRDLHLAMLRQAPELRHSPRMTHWPAARPAPGPAVGDPPSPANPPPASALEGAGQLRGSTAHTAGRMRPMRRIADWRRLAGRRAVRHWALATAVVAAIGILVPVAMSARSARAAPLADGIGELSGAALTSSVSLPGPPDAAIAADGSLWVASAEEDSVYRISPATDAVVQAVTVGSGPSAITADGDDIWVANTLDGTVSRINATVDQVVQTVPVGAEPTGVVAGDGRLWVTDAASSTLLALNLASGQPVARIALPSPSFGVTFGAGAVWVTSPADNSVVRVDPRTDTAGNPIRVGSGPTAITFGQGSVWIANELDSTVTRLNPATDRVAMIQAGDGVDALALSGHVIWAADRLAAELTRINGSTAAAGSPVSVDGTPVALAVVGGSLWVAVGPAENPPAPYGALRVVSVMRPTSIDPALQYPSMGPVFGEATYDTLVTFQKTGGSAGLQIVPDLAIGMPTISDGGTEYAFTIRPGLRYSNGEPVRAQDFRYAIERVMDLNASAASFLDGIVGASSCVPWPAVRSVQRHHR